MFMRHIGRINTLRLCEYIEMQKEVKNMAETLKQEARRFLADVPEEYVFRCHDGRILESMKELGNALNTYDRRDLCLSRKYGEE